MNHQQQQRQNRQKQRQNRQVVNDTPGPDAWALQVKAYLKTGQPFLSDGRYLPISHSLSGYGSFGVVVKCVDTFAYQQQQQLMNQHNKNNNNSSVLPSTSPHF